MHRVLEFFIALFLRFVLWFRYKIVFKGLENLNKENLNKPGGVLFLPNHPSFFVDPIAVTLGAWKSYPVRPMVVEYMYYAPVLYSMFKFINALPVPNFTTSSNSLKRKKTEKVMQTVIEGLKNKENFLIYPAAKVKLTPKEIVGSSGVHQIIQAVPEANIVLVRVKGLWGSMFSNYYGRKNKSLFEFIVDGVKICFKNLLFFSPRREVIIEFEPAPANFPYKGSRIELNQYLEEWYNRPDGLTPQEGKSPGDSLVLVSYSMWGEKYLEPPKEKVSGDQGIHLAAIPNEVKEKVTKKVAELSQKDPEMILPEMDLASDIGLDSLDIAELSAFLHDDFEVKGVPVNQITTVAKLMALAAKQTTYQEESEDEAEITHWKQSIKKTKLEIAQGETIAEVFLNNSEKMGKNIACGDMRTGVLNYKQLRMRAILLADYIRRLPGQYIGIMLPASVAANLLVLATEIAGKTPLMINWTVGPRHLESVVKLSNVQFVFSSWAFIDKLENVNLNGIEDKLIMLEDVRREISIWDKIKASLRSRRSTQSIMKAFGLDKINKNDTAVLLFTSGTESMPKGVPLSHDNLLSNMRSVEKILDVYSDDALFGILPPFHAFGFTISCLFGLLSGLKVASSPDPTDGRRLAHGIEKWGITLMCGAPTFLKGLFKAATPEQIATLRLCVTGAEKAPPELFKMAEDLGKADILLEGYGITECSPVLTANPINGEHQGVGQALPGIELCIVHPETYESIPTGSQGMILARGPNIFSGYLNKDVSTPFVEHDGKSWYKTGDLGFLNHQGYLTISGRLKRFVKIGGEMVSLASIEDSLLNGVLKSGEALSQEGPILAVSAKEEVGDKTKVILFSCFPATLDFANNILKESGFSNLVRISTVIQLKEIPLMGTGKVNYRALEAEYLNKG